MFSTVFIMLGEGCNFSCKYCLQHPILTEQLPVDINPALIDYLLNMEVLENKKIRVMFYGGEPLLYFDTIVEIVNILKEVGKFNFGIITNGSLLNDDMVNFINQNNMSLALSNDGVKNNQFRNINVLEDEEMICRLRSLNNFNVSSVLSAQNFDIKNDFLNYFMSKGIDSNKVNIDLIMDTGLTNRELTDFNFDDFQKAMNSVEEDIYESFINGKNNPVMGIANNFINRICYIASKDKESSNLTSLDFPKCGVGRNTLNVDLQGNCHLCHNSSVTIGTINDSYQKLVENFLSYDKYSGSEKCQKCPVEVLCSGGCLLVGDEPRDRYYCRMNQIYFGAVINALTRLNA